jgi:hypothetical protein
MKEFRAVFWSTTAIKLDILASLRFTQILVEQYRVMFEHEKQLKPWMPKKPTGLAQEFAVTFYKYLGSAHAAMNLATIGLPIWLHRMETLADVWAAKALLDEHVRVIRDIHNNKGEEGAEEYELLRFYRDFLSGRDLKPFWKFTTAYSSYLISQHEREKHPQRQIRPFTTTGLEDIIEMNSVKTQKKLTGITGNEGFKRIAYAIRQSTVTAQYRRTQLGDRTYEVRYGLGQELMREARYPDKFIAALSRFLQRYNAETAREEEKLSNKLKRALISDDRRTYKLRGSVAYTDIDAIVRLIDDFGSEQVCSLLVAYGYARDPYKGTTEEPVDNHADNTEPSLAELEGAEAINEA